MNDIGDQRVFLLQLQEFSITVASLNPEDPLSLKVGTLINRWIKTKMASADGLSLTRPKSPLLRPSRFSSGERGGTTVGELETANHQVHDLYNCFCKQRTGYAVDVVN